MDWRIASSARRRAVIALILALVGLALLAEPTLAAPDTCTWTGAVDDRWSVAGNWTGCDNGSVPEGGDALVFPTGAPNTSMTNDLFNLAYQSLTFRGGGGGWSVSPGSIFPMDPGDLILTNGAQVSIDQQLVLTASRTFMVQEGSTLEVTAENVLRLSGPGVRLTLDCVHVEFPPGTDFPAIRLFAQILGAGPGIEDGGITKNGTGTVQITNGNSYTGPTIVNGGVVEIFSDSALGSTSSGTTVQSGATLLSRANAPSEPLTIAGPGAPGTLGALMVDGTFGATVNWLGPITLAGPASIGGAELILNLDGPIGETPPGAGHALTFNGPNDVRIFLGGTAANTFTGPVNVFVSGGMPEFLGTLEEGGLFLAKPAGVASLSGSAVNVLTDSRLRIQPGSDNQINPLAALTLDPGSEVSASGNQTVGSLTGSGVLVFGVSFAVGTNTASTAFDGQIVLGSNSTFRKIGSGTLTLNGPLVTVGGVGIGHIEVEGGTLQVNGTVAPTIDTTVRSGGRLGGTGTLVREVVVATGGTVAPGISPGILSTGSVSFSPGSTLAVELNGTTAGAGHDQLKVTGAVLLDLGGDAGGANVNLVATREPAFVPPIGAQFIIVDNDGTDPVVSIFAGLPEGAELAIGGRSFRITYAGGTGNDIVLTAIGGTVVSVGNASAVEGNGGAPALSFPLSLSVPTTQPVSVTYTLSNGTALGGGACGGVTDFVSTGGTATIPANQTAGSIAVPLCPDTRPEPDETVTVTISAPVNATLGTATATGTVTNDDVGAPTAGVDLGLAKSHAGTFVVGQQGTYTLTVQNVGGSATAGVVTVTDVLPAGLSLVSAAGPGWVCNAAGQQVTCTSPGPIGPGASSQIVLTVAVGAAAVPSVTNTATVTATGDANPANNGAIDPTAVAQAAPGAPGPDLAMTVQANGISPGSPGTYLVTITNVGQGATTAPIDLSINLPTGVSFQSFAGAAVPGQSVVTRSTVGARAPGDWTCTATTPQQVACRYAGLLGPGQSTTLTLTVTVSPGVGAIGPATFTVTTPGDANAPNSTGILAGAVQAPPPQPVVPPSDPGDDKDRNGDKGEKLTEQERRQRERTNASSEEDERTEGNVVDVSGAGLDPPEVVIGTRDGPQTVRLVKEAKDDARHIEVGDYLEADGWKEHEGLFYADRVKIRRR